MDIDFSSEESAGDKIDEVLEKGLEFEALTRDEKILHDLTNAVRLILDRSSWVKHASIENMAEERERFREAREKGKDFEPSFRFKQFQYDETTFYELIDALRNETRKINQQTLEKYGAEKLGKEDFRQLFNGIFDDLETNVRLSANLEDRESWRKYSERKWPMVDEKVVKRSRKRLEEIEVEEQEKNLDSGDVKTMWQEELKRLGIDYNVEIRQTGGCFNIPEDRTVVVADGSEEKRYYSVEEAQMLTMHEIFHVLRAHNGFEAGRESGIPPILGLHTPFYDQAEEGGAIYREFETGTNYPAKEFDYHLRLVAAHLMYRGLEFQKVVEKLVSLGGSIERSFYLAARNREILRHHIYLGGYSDWKEMDRETREKMLIGKVNREWAEKLWPETGGMIGKPEVTAEKVFDYSFD